MGLQELDRITTYISLFVDVLGLQQLRNHLAFKFFLSHQRQLKPNINSIVSYLTFNFKKEYATLHFWNVIHLLLGTLKDQKREVIIRSFTEEKKTLSYPIRPPTKLHSALHSLTLISSEGCAHHAI